MDQQSIEITLADRKLNIACPKGQETALMAAAAELNSRLAQCKPNTSTRLPEHALTMASLNLANDFLKLKQSHAEEIEALNSKIQLLQATINKAILSAQEKETEEFNSNATQQNMSFGESPALNNEPLAVNSEQ